MLYLVFICTFLKIRSYLFAKAPINGSVVHYALYVDNTRHEMLFEYQPVGLESGFRTVLLRGVNLAGPRPQYVLLVVYRDYLTVFLDGELITREQLEDRIQDDTDSELILGQKLDDNSRFQGNLNLTYKWQLEIITVNITYIREYGSTL